MNRTRKGIETEVDDITLPIVTKPIPLETDADGVVRVGGTRVTLDTVVAAFKEGATAEFVPGPGRRILRDWLLPAKTYRRRSIFALAATASGRGA